MKVRLITCILPLIFVGVLQLVQAQQIRIDHVIVVVKDLEKAVDEYTQLGFTIKRGRLHANGLSNAHIKFRNGSSLELMSLQGEPKDALAQNYEALLQQGEGGVFLAMTGITTTALSKRLHELNIIHDVTYGKAWNYITFPAGSGREHIFFIEQLIQIHDREDVYTHGNGSARFDSVYTQGDDRLIILFDALGMEKMEVDKSFNMISATGYQTATGVIYVVPMSNENGRPRITQVVMEGKDAVETIQLRLGE